MVSEHQPESDCADDKISDISARDRWFRSISQRVMVIRHQSEGAIVDDKISDLLARDRWFRSISWRVIVQMIRYKTYRPEVDGFGASAGE